MPNLFSISRHAALFSRAHAALCAAAILAIGIAFAATAPAQTRPGGTTSANAANAKTRMVSVTVSFLSLSSVIQNVKYDTGGKPADIRIIPDNYRPHPVSYLGPETLEIYRETKDAEGKPVRTVIATAKFPASGNYLVLLKSVGGERYGTMVIPDDLVTPPNSWRLINLSTRTIGFATRPREDGAGAIKAFHKDVMVHSGQSVLLDYGPKAGYCSAQTFLPDARDKTKWALAHSVTRVHDAGVPRLLIYSDDPANAAHLNVQSLRAAVKPPTATPAPASGAKGRPANASGARR